MTSPAHVHAQIHLKEWRHRSTVSISTFLGCLNVISVIVTVTVTYMPACRGHRSHDRPVFRCLITRRSRSRALWLSRRRRARFGGALPPKGLFISTQCQEEEDTFPRCMSDLSRVESRRARHVCMKATVSCTSCVHESHGVVHVMRA